MFSCFEDFYGSVLLLQLFDLVVLVCGVVECYVDCVLVVGVDLGYDGFDDSVQVQGDLQLLCEVLGNLLDNVLCYGVVFGVIIFGVWQEIDGVQVWVDDDGVGIVEVECVCVMECFYWFSSEGDGCGLGLVIVVEIVQWYGVMLKIEVVLFGGVCVGLWFC